MALRHAVLAALLDGDASGYELAKRFDVSVANFWSATPQQLYRELDQLEQAGLVSGRVVEQQRRPNKRVFALTATGRAELRAFTAEPTRPAAMRDDLLVKLRALDVGDREALCEAMSARLEQARDKLARYDRLREDLLDGRDEDSYVREAEGIGTYLTLLGGRAYEQANIEWSTTVLRLLERR
ncbi:PadR family transcriptional regulator [Allokutzneria sp. A3M-2-11 16]|uniref:PadR family transcriptional regulator n=1 Tax=Allokutzneria sp. A3M-2-11 16 TaxID=2962043 RepID=UPI0020B68ED0|nr:PadR family transcriptional regulator [Allokutzneria sp. A3M-2-11 16]MCP3804816.1 PadR family transcriptional regulator [Allokutzneria sp. A3M-2-11 16]